MDENFNKKVDDLINISMENLNYMTNVNTAIGTPIVTESGCQIIPVSNVTVSYLSGGSDLGETVVIKDDETAPFAGGSGAIVSLRPTGFLIDDGKTCRYIHANDDPLDNLIDKTSELIKNLGVKHE